MQGRFVGRSKGQKAMMHRRLVCQSYLVLVPLVLYLVLMYRMLETACRDSNEALQHKHVLFLPSEGNSREIVQLKFNNDSNNVDELINGIKKLENEKQKMEYKLRFIKSKPILPKSELYIKKDSDIHIDGSNEGLSSSRYMFNCTNIHIIDLQTQIGHGVSKQTFKGTFREMPVAVKMVTQDPKVVKTCIGAINSSDAKRIEERANCFVHPTMRIMKEILLSEQLSHPGFVKLLGYCVRSEKSDSSDLLKRGVVSVFEIGKKIRNLRLTPWQERIRHSINLADFLRYLENSPLGSLVVRDFKKSHFLMVGKRIKMIDLDDVDNIEPTCYDYLADHHQDYVKTAKTSCDFGLPCNQGLCIGFNAKHNLKHMNTIFFKPLLYQKRFPKSISEDIDALNADIDSNLITASDIIRCLNDILEKGLNVSA